ncbi:MAG: hypothetical protein ROR55_19230 [Devosia sp.]
MSFWKRDYEAVSEMDRCNVRFGSTDEHIQGDRSLPDNVHPQPVYLLDVPDVDPCLSAFPFILSGCRFGQPRGQSANGFQGCRALVAILCLARRRGLHQVLEDRVGAATD